MADNQTLKEFEDSLKSIKQAQKEIEKDFGSGLVFNLQKAVLEADRLTEKFKKGDDVTKDLDKTVNRLLNTQITLNSKSLKLEKDLEKAIKTGNGYRQQSLKTQIESVNAQKKLTESLLTQVDIVRDINTSQKTQDDILKDILGKQATSIKQLFTLSGIYTFLINAALKADQQTTNIAKSLTLTKTQAAGVREQFVAFSVEIGDASVTTSRLIESFSQLTKQLGFNVPLSKSLLKEFTTLTKNIGISEDSAAGLAKITLATGRDARQVTTAALGTAQALQSQNGIQLNNREVLEDIGKISGQLLANFRANPTAIAAAVTQAKLLGTNLETVRKQGEALLNFESSIQNELEAELLTNRALNLEKARAAALNGDQVTLMKELNNQNIDFNKFSNMNVLAQQSLAKALGLSSDELSDQLLKQQYFGKSRAEVAALEGEAVAQRLEQLSAQDKFNNAMEKLQDIVGNLVAGPFGQLLDVVVDIANGVGYVFSIFQKLLGNTLFKILMGGLAGAGVGAAAGGIGAVPGAIVGALAAGVGATQAADDLYSGYGNRVLSTPQGSYALNNKDTVIAGTNLFKGDDVISLPKNAISVGGGGNNNALLEAIKGLRDDLQKPITVNNVINNNIERAGTAMYSYSHKLP